LNSIALISDASLIGLGISIINLDNLDLSVSFHLIAIDPLIDGNRHGEDFVGVGNDAKTSG
jgi:hypothetical protein